MAKRAATTADYDSPWKAALHKYLESFLVLPDELEEQFRGLVKIIQKAKTVDDVRRRLS